jgi:hypothetical protein
MFSRELLEKARKEGDSLTETDIEAVADRIRMEGLALAALRAKSAHRLPFHVRSLCPACNSQS